MRCSNCNVDLAEDCKTCPLCGAPAVKEPPMLEGMTQAGYPTPTQASKRKEKRALPNKWVLRVAAVLCLALCFTKNMALFSLVGPMILLGVAIYHFVCGLLEKGHLLHSAVALIAQVGVEVLLILVHLILRHNFNTTLFLGVVTIALTVCLYAIKPEQFVAQMKALLRM